MIRGVFFGSGMLLNVHAPGEGIVLRIHVVLSRNIDPKCLHAALVDAIE